MQLDRYTFILLLLSAGNALCMEKEISSLQQLCINAASKMVCEFDINTLKEKDTFERYSCLPAPLKNKIATVPMFFKLGHKYNYTWPGSGIFDEVHLDENNDHVCLLSEKDKILTIFKMGQKEEVASFIM